MIRHLRGVLKGKRIELDVEPGLPDGSPVTVHIESAAPSPEEATRLIDDLCGAWSADETIESVFEQIRHMRAASLSRAVNFDAPS